MGLRSCLENVEERIRVKRAKAKKCPKNRVSLEDYLKSLDEHDREHKVRQAHN